MEALISATSGQLINQLVHHILAMWAKIGLLSDSIAPKILTTYSH